MNQPPHGYRLSPQQERVWQLGQHTNGEPYHIHCRVSIQGELDFDLLGRAIGCVFQRHEILRTTLRDVKELRFPVQVIHEPFDLSDSIFSNMREWMKTNGATVDQKEVDGWCSWSNSLVKMRMSRRSANDCLLELLLPAIVADSCSVDILVSEIAAYYGSEQVATANDAPMQYADFAEWQNQLLEADDTAVGRQHWSQANRTTLEPIELPYLRKDGNGQDFRLQSHTVLLDETNVHRVISLAKELSLTQRDILIALWYLFVWRITGCGEVDMGVATDGRKYDELKGAVGLYSKYLPTRCSDLDRNETFANAARQIQTIVLENERWQEYFRLEELETEAESLGALSFFPVCFCFDEAPGPHVSGDVTFTVESKDAYLDRYRWRFRAQMSADSSAFAIDYDSTCFDPTDMELLVGSLTAFIDDVLKNPSTPVISASIVDRKHWQRIVAMNRATERPLPTMGVQELVRIQARTTPDRIAGISGNQHLSYGELDRQVLQLSRSLINEGLSADEPCGILMDAHCQRLVAMLAVLQSGAAYLPLDPQWPSDRINQILTDSKSRFLLTTEQENSDEVMDSVTVVRLDPDKPWGETPRPPAGTYKPDSRNLAYVMYTSGSTGDPKGVMIGHEAVSNHMHWMKRAFDFQEHDRVLHRTPFTFDASVWEVFVPLISGAVVVMSSRREQTEIHELVELMERQLISVIQAVPTLLSVLADEDAIRHCKSLTRVFSGGEILNADLASRLSQVCSARLYNLYGPTEATIDATSWTFQTAGEQEVVPIGEPIENVQAWIATREGSPVPIGISDHLFLGGVGLARGYLNAPSQTAERFVPNSFDGRAGSRVLRTGDLAHHDTDGVLHFHGRVDRQVKVRGFRIELGEIENAIRKNLPVKDIVVLLTDDVAADNSLIAFFVTDEDVQLDATQLMQTLAKSLPQFMLPARAVKLDKLPLKSNGKIDRKALMARRRDQVSTSPHCQPRNEIERTLVEIWKTVVELDQIGIDDDFFTIGGDSISAIRVVGLAKERGFHFSVQQLFEEKTIRSLAEKAKSVEENRSPNRPRIQPFELLAEADRKLLPSGLDDAYPLTMLQQGMLYHMGLTPEAPQYHNINTFHIGAPFDGEAFEEAVRTILNRHPVLRASIEISGFSQPLQLIHKEVPLPLTIVDCRHIPEQQSERLDDFLERQRSLAFDLTSPPLLTFHIHRWSDDRFQFTLTECHAISDGWSTTSTLDELFKVYFCVLDGEPYDRERSAGIQFQDFVASELEVLKSAEARDFWLDRVSSENLTTVPRWPISYRQNDRHLPHQLTTFVVPEETITGLRELAKSCQVSLKHVFHAAHMWALSRICGTNDVTSGMASNGRPAEKGSENVRGLFLNTLPFRLQLTGGLWLDLVKACYTAELEMLPYRNYPIAAIQKEFGGQSLFETSFGFLHFRSWRDLLRSDRCKILDASDLSQTHFAFQVIFVLEPVTSKHVAAYVEYDPMEFSEGQIQEAKQIYLAGLQAMGNAPRTRYDATPTPTHHDVPWQAASDRESPKDVIQVFQTRLREKPDAVAVVCDDSHLTYKKLNQKANQLAMRLRQLGLGEEQTVAIYLERSSDLVISMLAILKAKGVYVPLDLDSPAERLAAILLDSQAEFVITQSDLVSHLPDDAGRAICLDREQDALHGQPTGDWKGHPSPDGLAYVIFTSGSTGRPLGVGITHSSIVNLVTESDYVSLNVEERIAQAANCAFDASTFEIWGSLLNGGTIVFVQRDTLLSPNELESTLSKHAVTTLFITTSLFNRVADVAPQAFANLRNLLFGGESSDVMSVCRVLNHGPPENFLHVYGPTEATTFATWHRITDIASDAEAVPIGCPINRRQALVVGAHGRHVPVCVPGELHIAGDGLARGYFGNPTQTAICFTPNPDAGCAGERVYRSGDRVRVLPDAKIEFLGRFDDQIKLRGFRIELEEVRSALASHQEVREAFVMVHEREPGQRQIIAYVVSRSKSVSSTDLRQHMSRSLPDYMLPASFEFLPELPMTPNGKVDRRNLPVPSVRRPLLESEYIAPTSPAEQVLCEIWADTLKLEQVGIQDGFFELGGDSLAATRLAARIRDVFQTELPIRDLYERPTVQLILQSLRDSLGTMEWVNEIAATFQEVNALDENELRRRIEDERGDAFPS